MLRKLIFAFFLAMQIGAVAVNTANAELKWPECDPCP